MGSNLRRGWVAAALFTILLPSLVAPVPQAASSACGGSLLVGWSSDAPPRTLSEFPQLQVQRSYAPLSILHLQVPRGTEALWAARLRQTPGIRFAEPDAVAIATALPNDPLWPQQWGSQRIGAPAAWDLAVGGAETVVALLDSGINLIHPDLAGQLWTNPGEIGGNGLDDDGNGKVDDVHGWHFYHSLFDDVPMEDGDLSDDYGHGTGVAGIIGARRNNGEGIAGLAPGAQLMIVRVVDPYPRVCYSDLIAGVLYAVAEGAQIVNLSLGGTTDSQALHDAVIYAQDQGALLIAASGNAGGGGTLYPARYNEVLAVNGTDDAEEITGVWGPGLTVDLAAPGSDILTTWLQTTNGYESVSGTSFAAPHVTAGAALLRSLRPTASADALRSWLEANGDDVNGDEWPGRDPFIGWGRLNLARTLTAAATGLQLVVAAANESIPSNGGSTALQVTVLDEEGERAGSGVVVRLESSMGHIEPEEGITSLGIVTTTLHAGSVGGTAVITTSLGTVTHTVTTVRFEDGMAFRRYFPLAFRRRAASSVRSTQ